MLEFAALILGLVSCRILLVLPTGSIMNTTVAAALFVFLGVVVVFLLARTWSRTKALENAMFLRLYFDKEPLFTETYWRRSDRIIPVIATSLIFLTSLIMIAAHTVAYFAATHQGNPFSTSQWGLLEALLFWTDQAMRGALLGMLEAMGWAPEVLLKYDPTETRLFSISVGIFRALVSFVVVSGLLMAFRFSRLTELRSRIATLGEHRLTHRASSLGRIISRLERQMREDARNDQPAMRVRNEQEAILRSEAAMVRHHAEKIALEEKHRRETAQLRSQIEKLRTKQIAEGSG